MEFLRVGLIAFILFYFTWLQILGMLAFGGLFYYYANNKNLLLENSNYGNLLFYYFITFCEISYYYYLIGYEKFKNNCIGKYFHNYFESVNNKYLQLRGYLINKLFTLTVRTAVKAMMMIDKEEKNQKSQNIQINQKSQIHKKSTKNFDFNKFLDDLENN
jgi:hypothetical protein